MTDDERIEGLEAILLSYCKSVNDMQIVNRMMTDKVTPKDYVLALADGLRYGNWPWSNYSVNKFKQTTE